MRTIWKYPLDVIQGCQEVYMPVNAEILHVGQQGGIPTFWADVDLKSSMQHETRRFFVVATGDPIPPSVKYLGSVCVGEPGVPIIPGVTAFVWHIYEEVEQ